MTIQAEGNNENNQIEVMNGCVGRSDEQVVKCHDDIEEQVCNERQIQSHQIMVH